jgi:putative ABC transport system permease protein
MSRLEEAIAPTGSLAFLEALKTDLVVALRNVLRQRRRSLTGMLSVSFGVVALLLAGGFIEWVYWAMREGTIQSRLGHIQVNRAGYLDSGQSDPFGFLLPEAAPELHTIERLPGVVTVAPRLAFSGLISLGDSTLSFIGEGMMAEKEGGLGNYVLMLAGEPLDPSEPNGITLGEGLAANLGAKVGDTVVLLANTRSGGVNAVEVRVRGIFSTVTKAFDDVAIRIPLRLAQQLLRVSGAHTWVILLDDTARTEPTIALLAERVGGGKLEFVAWRELADFYTKTVSLFSKQVAVMKLIIALIIVLAILNTQTMSVLERTSEIGTSMALGVTKARLLRRFVLESFAIGLLGSAIGLIAGLALAALISTIGIPMPPPPGMARSFIGEIRVTRSLATDAVLLAAVTALLAGIYPAWKASRMVVVDALRHAR